MTANEIAGLGVDQTFWRNSGGASRSFYSDGLGSTLALTGGTGGIQAAYTYEPYGRQSLQMVSGRLLHDEGSIHEAVMVALELVGPCLDSADLIADGSSVKGIFPYEQGPTIEDADVVVAVCGRVLVIEFDREGLVRRSREAVRIGREPWLRPRRRN